MERQFEDLKTVTLERVVAGTPRRRMRARPRSAPPAHRDATRVTRLGFESGFLAGFILGLPPLAPSGTASVLGGDAVARSLLGLVL
jgi:hypothetical protein